MDDHTYFIGDEHWGFSLWVHNTYRVDTNGKVFDSDGNHVGNITQNADGTATYNSINGNAEYSYNSYDDAVNDAQNNFANSQDGNDILSYDPSDKHGKDPRNTSMGVSNPAPTNGQFALSNSVQIKPTSPRRVGVDKANNEFVVFDETHPGKGIYHGHTRSWNELTQEMKNVLVKAGLCTRKGRIL